MSDLLGVGGGGFRGLNPTVFGSAPTQTTVPVLLQGVDSKSNALEGTHPICIQLKTQMIKSAGNVPKTINDLLLSEKYK